MIGDEGPQKHDYSSYRNGICRCRVCQDDHNTKQRQDKANRMAARVEVDGRLVAPLPPDRHGLPTTYSNHGCQCEPCKAAWAAYCREAGLRRRNRAGGNGPVARASNGGVRTMSGRVPVTSLEQLQRCPLRQPGARLPQQPRRHLIEQGGAVPVHLAQAFPAVTHADAPRGRVLTAFGSPHANSIGVCPYTGQLPAGCRVHAYAGSVSMRTDPRPNG